MKFVLRVAVLALVGCDVPLLVGELDAGTVGVPRLLYLDQVAGPNLGGENDAGTYLSLFGIGFGDSAGLGTRTRVLLGGAEVARYVSLGPALGRPDVQQLTVQPGDLGGAAAGASLPVVVTLDAQPSVDAVRFTLQPGRIWFIDGQRGDDASAVAGDITRPFRTLQTPSGAGALGLARAGDVLVFRGGLYRDVGATNRWARFANPSGSAPTGQPGTGYLTLVAYPNEEVRYRPPTGTSGGLHGTNTPGAGPSFIVISGLHIEGGDATVGDGPINLQSRSNSWRVVNNELGPWQGSPAAASGGIAGNGRDVALLGNSIHDISGGNNNCIGLDSGSTDVELAWNWIDGCTSKDGIHLFDLQGVSLERISIHHNRVGRVGQHALLLADNTISTHVYDNLFEGSNDAAIRLNLSGAAVSHLIEHNTLVHPCLTQAMSSAAVLNTGAAIVGSVTFSQNVIVAGPASKCTVGFLGQTSGASVEFANNLWSGATPPGFDTTSTVATAAFASGDAGIYVLAEGSAGADRGTSGTVTDDYAGLPRDATPDLGAFERPKPGAARTTSPAMLRVGCSSGGGGPLVVGAAALGLLRLRRARLRRKRCSGAARSTRSSYAETASVCSDCAEPTNDASTLPTARRDTPMLLVSP